MKKPPLEFCIANISDNFSIKRINNIIEYVETLSFKYSKVRVMLDFNGENADLINSMLSFIKKSKLENFVIAILGNAKDVAKLSNLQKTGLSAFIKIEDYLDVQKIEEIKIPVEAVIMRLTPQTIPYLNHWYNELRQKKIQIQDLFNIKYRVGSGELTPDNILDIIAFSTSLKDEYCYLPERDEVTNKSFNLPIKSIRPIRKFLMKLGYDLSGLTVEYGIDDKIHFSVSGKTMTKEEFAKITVIDDEEKLPQIGVKTEECENCQLKGECSKYGDITLNKPYDGFCEEAKFNYAMFQGIARIPQTEARLNEFTNKPLRLA